MRVTPLLSVTKVYSMAAQVLWKEMYVRYGAAASAPTQAGPRVACCACSQKTSCAYSLSRTCRYGVGRRGVASWGREEEKNLGWNVGGISVESRRNLGGISVESKWNLG